MQTNLVFIILLITFIGLTAIFFIFLHKYKKTIKIFEETKKELNDSKDVLRIRVKAKTRELEETVERLNKQVKKNTEELQQKVEGLERFQRMAVGRELKMIELKKEIQKLKKRTNK